METNQIVMTMAAAAGDEMQPEDSFPQLAPSDHDEEVASAVTPNWFLHDEEEEKTKVQEDVLPPPSLRSLSPLLPEQEAEMYTYQDTCRLVTRLGVAATRYGLTCQGVETWM